MSITNWPLCSQLFHSRTSPRSVSRPCLSVSKKADDALILSSFALQEAVFCLLRSRLLPRESIAFASREISSANHGPSNVCHAGVGLASVRIAQRGDMNYAQKRLCGPSGRPSGAPLYGSNRVSRRKERRARDHSGFPRDLYYFCVF